MVHQTPIEVESEYVDLKHHLQNWFMSHPGYAYRFASVLAISAHLFSQKGGEA